MLYCAKYAEKKFDILHKYKVYLTQEQVEDTVKLGKSKKRGKYFEAVNENIKVIYLKDNGEIKIVTFFPVK